MLGESKEEKKRNIEKSALDGWLHRHFGIVPQDQCTVVDPVGEYAVFHSFFLFLTDLYLPSFPRLLSFLLSLFISFFLSLLPSSLWRLASVFFQAVGVFRRR